MIWINILQLVTGITLLHCVVAHDRILLSDVQALTLHHDRYTNARRSSAIPQLRCIGGTAGCSAFVPKVVRCKNEGSDGYDAQWTCKADMSTRYRFGKVQVNCEGYDYPNDPYVLKGSCGLEYTLDLTEKGRKSSSGGTYTDGRRKHGGSMFSNIVPIIIIFGVMYFIYKTCLARTPEGRPDDTTYPSAPPPYPGSSSGPPPPGFRQEYMPGYDDCNDTRYRSSAPPPYSATGQAEPDSGPGFWSGAALGGVMGYLFGSGGQRGGYERSYYSTNYDSSHCDSPTERLYPDASTFRDSSESDHDSTRTASGFGGTTRR